MLSLKRYNINIPEQKRKGEREKKGEMKNGIL